MSDYLCRYCQDKGNCSMCSWFFESDTIHSCGYRWGDHVAEPPGYVRHNCPEGDH